MGTIGGNKSAIIQMKGITQNEISEDVCTWNNVLSFTGWLDLLTGDSGSANFNAKMQESTHVFLCDYLPLVFYGEDKPDEAIAVTPENSRMVVDDKIYEVTLYDDPMEMHEHLEIFLKFTGG